MSATYRVRIRTVNSAPPETAAVRLIALLPDQWAAALLCCTEGTVTLALAPPNSPSSAEVASVIDEVLVNSAMRGWIRDEVASPRIGRSEGQGEG
ncbi:hypothetical protein G3I77_35345 [Streptomyces sp. D2-8]|uniref:hypothetical protein n=1 Tax=Streptomyces sp. D2-8 TaxID=2707767 RepID=UPI0020BFD4FD|nr:hypothetical protein [Streptomyces sp. D2-8]MCK8438096.1 hypothetical protein [Streptomyces sp. D2-8]